MNRLGPLAAEAVRQNARMADRTEVDAFEDLKRHLARLDEVNDAFDKSERGSEEASKLGHEQQELHQCIWTLLGEITSIVKRRYHVP